MFLLMVTSLYFLFQRKCSASRCCIAHPPFSFPRKKTGGVTVQKKGVCIVCLPLNILFACGLHCLPSVVSKRLGLLLSPLSLCLRIGSLHQFPSISDILLYFIIVDRSVSFQQIQVYMQSFSASLVLHTVFCLSADQFVQRKIIKIGQRNERRHPRFTFSVFIRLISTDGHTDRRRNIALF